MGDSERWCWPLGGGEVAQAGWVVAGRVGGVEDVSMEARAHVSNWRACAVGQTPREPQDHQWREEPWPPGVRHRDHMCTGRHLLTHLEQMGPMG